MLPRMFLLTVVLLIAVAVTSCGNNEDEDELATVEHSTDAPGVDLDSDPDGEVAGDHDVAGAEFGNDRSDTAQISTNGFDRRVIRSAELEIEVSDVRASVRHARDLAEDYGGHVESSTARALSDGDEVANLTLEIPSTEFDRVLDELRDAPHVVGVEHESTSSRDVTEEYVDLRARLGNLESTESRYVALLDEAVTISEILDIENEISRLRGEIEQIQGRLNYLEQRTDYSRIYVAFHPEEDATVQVAGQHFTPVETAREAWNASMQFMGAIGNGLVAVGVFFWWGWPLLAIAVALVLRYRRRGRGPFAPVQA